MKGNHASDDEEEKSSFDDVYSGVDGEERERESYARSIAQSHPIKIGMDLFEGVFNLVGAIGRLTTEAITEVVENFDKDEFIRNMEESLANASN